MQHHGLPCQRRQATWLALLAIACLLLPVLNVPGANAAPRSPQAGPNPPTLVSPADGATGVAMPPELSVSVSDADGDPLTVRFYGRVKSPPTPDFMIVALPDIQNETQYNSAMLNSQMNWIVNQQAANNIVFTTSVGDLINTSTSTTQYNTADAAFDLLDAGGAPYSVGPGNHDMMSGTLFNQSNYFGPERFAGKTSYQGHYGSDNFNNYSFFSASGMDFILINLQYSPSSAQITWADNLLKANPARRGIVEQHDILNTNNSWNNQTSYNTLRSNPNLFLMLCGHMHASNDGAAYVAGTGTDGHTIHVVMQDYQDFSNGNGWLRRYRFSPENDLIYMTTYSPYTSGSITTDPDQKNLAYDMPGAPPFELIGTVAGVASGGTAAVSWPDRVTDIQYEWYATATDAGTTTTSATWSFTTGAAVPCYTLTLGHSGSGSTPSATPPKSPACGANGQYFAGATISLSGASAALGWEIGGWSGTSDDVSTAATNSLVMPASATSAGVSYVQSEYTLTVNKAGSGDVAADPDQPSYHYGDVVELTATADPLWVFTGWSGDCAAAGACSVTMNGNKTVTATFVPMAVPEAPVITSIAIVGQDVVLAWDAVMKDVNGNPAYVDEYRVYGSVEPYFTAGTLLLPSPATTTFAHTGVAAAANKWFYLVRAHAVVGESADCVRRTGTFGFELVAGTEP